MIERVNLSVLGRNKHGTSRFGRAKNASLSVEA
jgi:hypothetical protein